MNGQILDSIFHAAIGQRIFFSSEPVARTDTRVLLLHRLPSNRADDPRDTRIALSLHDTTGDAQKAGEPLRVWGSTIGYDHDASMAEAMLVMDESAR